MNTGVPHTVVPVAELDDADVQGLGRQLRFHAVFGARGTNVNFIEAVAPARLKIRTYERGVEGETLACGTGVTAAAIIHVVREAVNASGKQRREIEVETKSGEVLRVSFDLVANVSARLI